MIGDVMEWLSSCLPPLTIAGNWTKDRGSWLVESSLWKICGLRAQTWTSCWLVVGEKGTWLSSVEGQRTGFTVSHPELLPRPRPPLWDKTLQCEATQAVPSTRNQSCSVSYKPPAHLSALLGQKNHKLNPSQLKNLFSHLHHNCELQTNEYNDRWLNRFSSRTVSLCLTSGWLFFTRQTILMASSSSGISSGRGGKTGP